MLFYILCVLLRPYIYVRNAKYLFVLKDFHNNLLRP
jgi:hypothetical protein